jgi:hypothetical protein
MSAFDMLNERVVVASILAEPKAELPSSIIRVLDFAPEAWTSPECGAIAASIRKVRGKGSLCDAVSIAEHLTNDQVGVLAQISNESGNALPLALAAIHAEKLLQLMRSRRVVATLGEAWQEAREHPERAESIAERTRAALVSLSDELPRSPAELLKQREFDPQIQPPPLRVIYTLAGQPISTPGNVTTVTSAIKTGKSAVVGAMAAAAMPHDEGTDLLGFDSSNSDGFALLWFDSEQSPEDSWNCVYRACRRAKLDRPPPWLHHYCLTGLRYELAWECVLKAIQIAIDRHGGIHSLLLDGAADFVKDVNDAAESNAFVAEVQDLTIRLHCPIVGVIHFNPGTDKPRGHLGSQLERKAETNLRLDKCDGVTTIWSDKQRRAPVPKDQGPCFRWSDEHQMHVSVQNRQASKVEFERGSLSLLAQEIFSERPSMRYSDLAATIKNRMRVSLATAERRVARMHQLGVIKKPVAGLYVLAT